jgi:hypothetical protein
MCPKSVPHTLSASTPSTLADPRDQIRIAFDGDAVLFSDESERIFQQQGLPAFHEHESRNAHVPLADGPFARLLRTQPVIPNCVDDPIVAYANPVEVVYPAKLLDTVRPWFKSQCTDTRRNALLNFSGKAGELLERRWGDLKLIARFRSYGHLSEP